MASGGDPSTTSGGSTWLSSSQLWGSFDAAWDAPDTISVQVQVDYQCGAWASGDNCVVTQDMIVIDWNLETYFD